MLMRKDREAMQASIDATIALGGVEADQIRDKLRDDGFEEAGRHAAHHMQIISLSLRPWQEPPCVCSEIGVDRDAEGQKLLSIMLAAGLSRYVPDPVAALEANGLDC